MNQQNQYNLSIIIPVFNGQDTIIRCLDSIFSIKWQERSYEVIVIDDCSTDNTLQILNDSALKHDNLTVIHLPVNSKPGAARNKGIRQALGQYLFFVDADDTVENGIISALDYALKNRPDLLQCRIREQMQADCPFIIKEYPTPEHTSFKGQEFCEKYYDSSIHGAFIHYLFNAMYIKRLRRKFVENVVYEDLDWVEYHLFNATSIEYDPSVLYSYYFSPSSILHKDRGPKDVDAILLCFRRLQFAYSVKDTSPAFFQKISPISDWIYQMLSFKRLSRYKIGDLKSLITTLNSEAIPFFSLLKWHGFTNFFISSPQLAFVFISVSRPLTSALRLVYHFFHK